MGFLGFNEAEAQSPRKVWPVMAPRPWNFRFNEAEAQSPRKGVDVGIIADPAASLQ